MIMALTASIGPTSCQCSLFFSTGGSCWQPWLHSTTQRRIRKFRQNLKLITRWSQPTASASNLQAQWLPCWVVSKSSIANAWRLRRAACSEAWITSYLADGSAWSCPGRHSSWPEQLPGHPEESRSFPGHASAALRPGPVQLFQP